MDTSPRIATAEDGAAARLSLTRSEAARCAGLPTAAGRSDFRAGRLAAKRAAGSLLRGRAGRRIEVWSLAHGAPSLSLLDGRGRRTPMGGVLSISHRDARAVAAVAPPGVRVGIDLERAGSVPIPRVRFFLTPAERRTAAHVDPTILWSLKEAAWKALGLGRSLPFTSLELRRDAGGRLIGVEIEGTPVPMRACLARPWRGFHLVVVWTVGGVA